jgi:DNA primase
MDQIEQVRRKVDIVELISQSVALKKAGRNFKANCPFHEEKTPSFMVSPERQIFKCFGCGEGGDVYGWLMKREGMEFGEALRTLADRVGVKLKSYRPTKEQQMRERLLEINHLASEYYHYLLVEHKLGKNALQYLMKRGIRKASMRTFKLGYSPNEWEGLQGFLVKKKGYRPQELEMAGLVIKGKRGYYDRFRNRVMFSLFDHRGRVVGFAGRVFEEEAREAKYVNTPETSLYHKSEVLYGLETTKEQIKKADKAVVVEGELDVISSYQAGVKNVVGIKGSALTEGQVELLKRFGENVALALDADVAGDKAARRGIELAEQAGLSVRVIELKYGKDPDECSQKSSRLWKESVKTAVPIYDFYITSAVERFGVKTPEGKRKVSDEVVGVLVKISNQVIKAHYVKKLAGVLGVGEEAVGSEVEKAEKKTKVERQPVKEVEKAEVEKSREERLSEYVLALVLQREDLVGRLVKQVEEGWLVEGAAKKVMKKLKEWVKKGRKWQVNRFVKSLEAELVGVVDEAYLTELGKRLEDEDRLEVELGRTMEELRKIGLKAEMRRLSEMIREAEKGKDKQKLMRLQKKFVEVSKELKL